MSQAKDYVSVLERINAVGMSVQILETLEDDDEKVKQKNNCRYSKTTTDFILQGIKIDYTRNLFAPLHDPARQAL